MTSAMPGPLGQFGRLLLALAALLALLGGLLLLADRFPWLRIGRLPGDIVVDRERFKLYFPLATSLVLSIVLSLILWLFRRRG